MGKLFLRTFGCQMNEYDSEKIADVLREAEGLEPAARPEDADLIVFNTCSVREKAQEKLFADLGRVKHLKRAKPGLMIAVGGCVASQEGPAVIERARLERNGRIDAAEDGGQGLGGRGHDDVGRIDHQALRDQ